MRYTKRKQKPKKDLILKKAQKEEGEEKHHSRLATGRWRLGWSPLARGTEESGGLMRYRGGRDPTKGAYEE
ncbi:hypothetical protein BHE74_00019369 [Ensete ventricosum]|nr:hypothetical protein BHE74_00019369 [Ensete ventricosum]